MIVGNNKPLIVIGYTKSSVTDEFVQLIHDTHTCEVITPSDFYSMSEKSRYQYIVSARFYREERLEIINFLEKEGLDQFTFIHNTCVMGTRPSPTIGAGSFIFPNVIIGLSATIGKNCIISSQSMVGHYSLLGDNCWLKPGVMIVGKSSVGKNCILNTRSTIINQAQIADDVELLGFAQVRKSIKQAGRYGGNPIKKFS
jgi:UDP-3-O-[3-hydroxymyristoyl] glucosamine N-acyltransferase